MPTAKQVSLYEAGLRVTQALEAFPDPSRDDATLSDAFRKAVLRRLNSALKRLARHLGTAAGIAQRGLQIVADANEALRSRAECPYVEVHLHLVALRDEMREADDDAQDFDEDDGRWLQLGLEIANGRGNGASEGHPTYRDGQLVFVERRHETWQWTNHSRVQQLLAELDEDVDCLRPTPESLVQEDWDRFPGLPSCLWIWCALEAGLLQLRDRVAATAAARPRRGRRPNPDIPLRSAIIRAARAAHPELSDSELSVLLAEQQPDIRFTEHIVRNTFRES